MRTTSCWWSGLCVCLLACCAARADSTGAVVGSLHDPSGAVVAAARIEVLNRATGIVRESRTSPAGDYDVVLLPPGVYDITVRKDGFRTAQRTEVDVAVDQIVRVDFELLIALVKTDIDVTDVVPLVDSDSSSVGAVVESKHIQTLPLNERNYLNFTLLVPGAQTPVAGSQTSTQGGSVSVNGAREQANTFLLDGVDNNDLLINRSTVLPSVDAIEEFKVQSSTSAAEYGRSGGAQINVVLKSGANTFHGALFEYFRNRKLDAKNFFDLPDCRPGAVPGTCAEIPRFQRDQFGGTFGGPIRRNRTFFFAAYEGLRLRQATTRESTVPSQAQRAAVLAAVPPAFRNPAGMAALDLYPAANVGPDLVNSTRFLASPVIRSAQNQGSLKLDHQLSSHDLLSAHYAIFDEGRYNPFDVGFSVSDLPGFGDNVAYRGHNLGVNWTHSFGPRLTNEVRAGFNRDRLGVFQEHLGTNFSAQLGFPSPTQVRRYGYPIVQVSGFEDLGEPFQAPEDNFVNTFDFNENVAWSPDFDRSRHHFKFGGEWRRYQDNGYADFFPRGIFIFIGVTGSPLQDLVLGVPAVALFGSGSTDVHLRSHSLALYAADNYRVAPRFTLNLGLRYEYNSPPSDVNNELSVPDLSANSATCSPKPNCQFIVAGTHGIPRGTYNTGKKDFAPRIGFAWKPLAGDRVVVRSAYGIYYDITILDVGILLKDNPPFYRFAFSQNSGTNVIQNILSSPASSIISLRASPNFKDAYLQQWNFGVQTQLSTTSVLEVAYVGSKGTHLIGFRDDNQSPSPGAAPPYPQFGSLGTMDTDRASNYHSLQLRAEERNWHGLSYRVAYTWSKSLDNGSEFVGSATGGQYAQNAYNLRGERGRSSFDTRHRMVFSDVYTPKIALRAGVMNALVRNWELGGILSLQTGQPFTVNRSGYQSFQTLVAGSDRPDLIADPFTAGPVAANPNPACRKTISQGGLAADRTRTPASWINPCAYADPNLLGQFRFGSAPRNSIDAPGLAELDVSLSRRIALRSERQQLSVRMDVFNVLNHPNFDPPQRIFDSANFGSLVSANRFGTRPPRQLQLALRYAF